MKKIIHALLVSLFLLNLTDAITTWMALKNPQLHEGNPLMAYLLAIGPWPFFLVKTIIMSGVIAAIYFITGYFRHWRRMLFIPLCIAVLLNLQYVGLLVSNAYQYSLSLR